VGGSVGLALGAYRAAATGRAATGRAATTTTGRATAGRCGAPAAVVAVAMIALFALVVVVVAALAGDEVVHPAEDRRVGLLTTVAAVIAGVDGGGCEER